MKYSELRFDKGHLDSLENYEFIDKIDKGEKAYRDDPKNFLRFRFYEINYEVVNAILKELNFAFMN